MSWGFDFLLTFVVSIVHLVCALVMYAYGGTCAGIDMRVRAGEASLRTTGIPRTLSRW